MPHNETQTQIEVFNYLTDKNFIKKWVSKKTENDHIQNILSKASKSNKQNRGEPDLIYLNEDNKLLILIAGSLYQS